MNVNDALLLQTLTAAYELIKDEAHWIQKDFAMSKNFQSCSAFDPNACAWCLSGALLKSANEICVTKNELDLNIKNFAGQNLWIGSLNHVNKFVQPVDTLLMVANFNDTHSHGEVLELLQKAIDSLATESNAP